LFTGAIPDIWIGQLYRTGSSRDKIRGEIKTKKDLKLYQYSTGPGGI
jgi:hypothetical protein